MMRNLLLAALAITAFGCESCWDKRETTETVSATPATPPPAPTPAPTPPPAIARPAQSPPPPGINAITAVPEADMSPEELAKERALESRRQSNPLHRMDPKQIRLGGKRVLTKPSGRIRMHERPLEADPGAPAPGATPPAGATAPSTPAPTR